MKMDLTDHAAKLAVMEKKLGSQANDKFVSVAIKESLRARCRAAAGARNMRLGDFINQALEAALK